MEKPEGPGTHSVTGANARSIGLEVCLMLSTGRRRCAARLFLVAAATLGAASARADDIAIPEIVVTPYYWPTATGKSKGHWEGDTLVSVMEGASDRTLIDDLVPHGYDLKVTEHYRLIDADTLEDRVTIEDPAFFSRPWKAVVTYKRQPDAIFPEDICLDRIDAKHAAILAACLDSDQFFFGGVAAAAGAVAVARWRPNMTIRCTLSLTISASRVVPPVVASWLTRSRSCAMRRSHIVA